MKIKYIYCKCLEYQSIKFKGWVHVVDDKVTKCTEHNNYVPSAAKIEAKKVIPTIKIYMCKVHARFLLLRVISSEP